MDIEAFVDLVTHKNTKVNILIIRAAAVEAILLKSALLYCTIAEDSDTSFDSCQALAVKYLIVDIQILIFPCC